MCCVVFIQCVKSYSRCRLAGSRSARIHSYRSWQARAGSHTHKDTRVCIDRTHDRTIKHTRDLGLTPSLSFKVLGVGHTRRCNNQYLTVGHFKTGRLYCTVPPSRHGQATSCGVPAVSRVAKSVGGTRAASSHLGVTNIPEHKVVPSLGRIRLTYTVQ